jgi:hypothetical protein
MSSEPATESMEDAKEQGDSKMGDPGISIPMEEVSHSS